MDLAAKAPIPSVIVVPCADGLGDFNIVCVVHLDINGYINEQGYWATNGTLELARGRIHKDGKTELQPGSNVVHDVVEWYAYAFQYSQAEICFDWIKAAVEAINSHAPEGQRI